MANTVVQPPIANADSITDPVYQFKSDNGFFSAQFAQTIGTDNAVMFTTNGYTFGWKPDNVIYVDNAGNMDVVFGVNAQATAQVYKNRVTYVGTSQITTDIFDCNANELKHTIQMVAPPRIPASYMGTPVSMASGGTITYDSRLSVYANGQTQTTDFEVTGDIGFKDADGNLVYKLPMITAEDANGNTTQGTYKVTFNTDGTISFYGMVPWDFLQTAAYPVVIDPTVVVSSAYDTSNAGGRKIVHLSNGWIVTCAYYSTNGNVYFYVSKDNGQTWTQLCYALYGGGGTAIASNGTTIYCISQTNNNLTQNYFYVFDATTVTNAALTAKSNPDTGQASFGSGVSLAVDGNEYLHAVWVSKSGAYPNSSNIRYGKSTDGGATWGVTQLSTDNTSGTDNLNPCIVVRSNNLPTVFWQKGVAIVSCVYNGTSWVINNGMGTTVVYSNNNYAQYNPCAAVDGNDVIHLVWHGEDSTNTAQPNMKYSSSSDGGNTWSAMYMLTSDNTHPQYYGTITIDPNSNVYVLYRGIDLSVSGYGNIRKLVKSGGTWGNPVTLTNNTTADANYPQSLWSKFNMNSSDAIRYIWQDNQAASVKYDSISLNQPPNAPTLTAHANFDATTAQTLAWTFSDPNTGDTQSAYQLQIYDTANTSTAVIDTGKVGSTQSSYALAANALTNGKNYQWRVITWDQSGASSPWSSYSTFKTSATPVATETSPASGSAIPSDSYTFTGSYTQSAGVVQQSSQFKLWDSPGTTVVQDSGTIVGTSNAKTFSGLANNTSYNIEFIVTSQDGVSASSGKVPFSVAYTPPATPIVATSNDATNARVSVTFTNPTPSGSQPTVSSNNVYRRRTGDTTWKLLQQGATSPFYDYTCPVGSYDYGVTGVSAAGAASGYGVSTTQVSFAGEWVVDESNPANSVVFLYNQRQSDATVNQSYNPVQTFAKYPRIRKGQARYRTGNLTALKLSQDGDVMSQVDAIDNMCNSDNTYLLKSVNGRIYRVSLSEYKYTGHYGRTYADVSVKWTEVGDV